MNLLYHYIMSNCYSLNVRLIFLIIPELAMTAAPRPRHADGRRAIGKRNRVVDGETLAQGDCKRSRKAIAGRRRIDHVLDLDASNSTPATAIVDIRTRRAERHYDRRHPAPPHPIRRLPRIEAPRQLHRLMLIGHDN